MIWTWELGLDYLIGIKDRNGKKLKRFLLLPNVRFWWICFISIGTYFSVVVRIMYSYSALGAMFISWDLVLGSLIIIKKRIGDMNWGGFFYWFQILVFDGHVWFTEGHILFFNWDWCILIVQFWVEFELESYCCDFLLA